MRDIQNILVTIPRDILGMRLGYSTYEPVTYSSYKIFRYSIYDMGMRDAQDIVATTLRDNLALRLRGIHPMRYSSY